MTVECPGCGVLVEGASCPVCGRVVEHPGARDAAGAISLLLGVSQFLLCALAFPLEIQYRWFAGVPVVAVVFGHISLAQPGRGRTSPTGAMGLLLGYLGLAVQAALFVYDRP